MILICLYFIVPAYPIIFYKYSKLSFEFTNLPSYDLDTNF